MLTWNIDARDSVDALSHYQIIRRNGAVVPFAPNDIAVALMKAFLAVHANYRDAQRHLGQVGALICSYVEQFTHWICQFRRFELDVKSAILVNGTRVRRNSGTVVQLGAGMGQGFFSAAKPNLRNAP